MEFLDFIDQQHAVPTRRKSNLSKSEYTALRQLNQRTDIVIKEADKNLGTTVLNSEDYYQECIRQLSDSKYYRKVGNTQNVMDLCKHFQELSVIESSLSAICNEYSHLLSKKDAISLFTSFPFVPARFYTLPKIHKDPGPFGPVGRPIVSCVNYCTAPASRFVDFYLKEQLESIVNGVSLSVAKLLDTRLEKLEKSITDLSVSVDTLKTEFGGLKTNVNMVEAKQKRLESRLVKVERTLAENSNEFDERVREAIGVIQRKEKDIFAEIDSHMKKLKHHASALSAPAASANAPAAVAARTNSKSAPAPHRTSEPAHALTAEDVQTIFREEQSRRDRGDNVILSNVPERDDSEDLKSTVAALAMFHNYRAGYLRGDTRWQEGSQA